MRPIIDRAIWLMTGGYVPAVHSVILGKRRASVTRCNTGYPQTLVNTIIPTIKAYSQKFHSDIKIGRMAIEGIRPVRNIIPFHLDTLPIKGLTLPSMKVITKIRHFIPRMILKSIKFGFTVLIKSVETLEKKRHAESIRIQRFRTPSLPVPLLRRKGIVVRFQKQQIPRYFVRLRPTSFSYFKPIELATRKIGFAHAMGIEKGYVRLLAIFRNIEIFSSAEMEFDSASATLIRRFDFTRDVRPRRCDVIVGCDVRDGRIHIALYKSGTR